MGNLQAKIESLLKRNLLSTSQAVWEELHSMEEGRTWIIEGSRFSREVRPYPAAVQLFEEQSALEDLGFQLFFSRSFLAGLAHEALPEDARGLPLAEAAFLQGHPAYRRQQAARDACRALAQASAPPQAMAWLERNRSSGNGLGAVYTGYWLGDHFRRQYAVKREPKPPCLARWAAALGLTPQDQRALHSELEKVYRIDLIEEAWRIAEGLDETKMIDGRAPLPGAEKTGAGKPPAVRQAWRAQRRIEALGRRVFFSQGFFAALGGLQVPQDEAGRPLAAEDALQKYRAYQTSRAAQENGLAGARAVLSGEDHARLLAEQALFHRRAAYVWPRMLYLGFFLGDGFLRGYDSAYQPQAQRIIRWAQALEFGGK